MNEYEKTMVALHTGGIHALLDTGQPGIGFDTKHYCLCGETLYLNTKELD